MSGATPPVPGSASHTLSESEWLAEQQALFIGTAEAPGLLSALPPLPQASEAP